MSSVASALARRHAEPALKEYDSFESALRDSDSYEDPRLIDVVAQKTRRYRETLAASASRKITNRQTAQILFVLSHVQPDHPLEVLEVGGACGAGYFEVKNLLPERIARWSITETPAMAAAGNKFAKEDQLSFHSDLTSATSVLGRRDLAIAQGVLQYASNPLQLLRDLLELGFSYVYVTRTVVAVGANAAIAQPIFTRQETDISAHGPGKLEGAAIDGKSSQPLTIAGLESVSQTVSAAGELLYWFDESDDRVLTIGSRPVTVRDIGFLAKKSSLR